MIGEEREGNGPLLQNCCFHDSNLVCVPMDICEPVVIRNTQGRESIIHQGQTVTALAMRLTRRGGILLLEMLTTFATNVVWKARARGYSTLCHHLHGPMRKSALTTIMTFPIVVGGARRHMQPREDILGCIPIAIGRNAHSSVNGSHASESPATATMSLVKCTCAWRTVAFRLSTDFCPYGFGN